MFTHRTFRESDAEEICTFPQTKEELFYLFPAAEYPLTPGQLITAANSRYCPTVVRLSNHISAYGNFIRANPGDFCSIGNVIVNPLHRRKGAATYLIRHMVCLAFEEFNAGYVRISCFNHNTSGLLLYHKLGFIPVDMEVRKNSEGETVALIHMHLNRSRTT